ncbi:MAG: sigma-54-dependent Fis family transcriptional regulator [Thermoanaerobaculia bacterium]|nr:MAG: sigma-54-dependent Fis family transcriptional regulator [Thermoanaerobaculia bacterium]
MAVILLVEDEKLLRWALQKQLERAGHVVHEAADLLTADEHLSSRLPDLVLLDLNLPDGHGLDFYERNRERLSESAVIVMTAVGQINDAVRAMKLGALDFLTKPVDQAELVALVERSLAVRSDQLEAVAARQGRELSLAQKVVGESPAFRDALEMAEQVATSEVNTILIRGESGTGKNVVARFIHSASARRARPLLELSCATIPENLLETELFGHERGAFTDAKVSKRGVLELGDGGTVVLDEIGELRLDLQAKLLHFLEERRFRRVGGTREIAVDVRVVALTNRDLQAMVRDKSFRGDLFFRLSVFPLALPTLRERAEDVLPLARHFLSTLQPKLGRRFAGFDREAENRLLTYAWPGNVRELRNVVERAMVLERGERIGPRSLVLDWAGPEEPDAGAGAPGDALAPGIVPLEEMEREMVTRAMRFAGDNQTRAAELLGITRDQLRYRLKKFGLRDEEAGTT